MDIPYLIQLLNNKVAILNNAKSQAFSVGDLDRLNVLDKDLLDTQNTLTQLNMLANVAAAAAVANVTPADIVASGLYSVQSTTPIVQGPSAGAIIHGYDVSAYATDPLYEQKIWNILGQMPTFAVVGDIDAYIQGVASSSPLTGEMVYKAVNQYAVDLPLLVAIMQNDSSFGTAGVAVSTLNPGNVGNTGYETRTYGSWSDGVMAVAEWLSRHRATVSDTSTNSATPITDATAISAAATTTADTNTDPAITPVAPVAPLDPNTPINTPASTVSTSTASVSSNATSTEASTPSAVAASSTATSSPQTTDTAAASTSTSPADLSVSTSTATSTSPLDVLGASNTATTTQDTTSIASTTVTGGGVDEALSASSTPEVAASSTQALRRTSRKNRA